MARRYLAGWPRRGHWPAPGTRAVRTRSLCTQSTPGRHRRVRRHQKKGRHDKRVEQFLQRAVAEAQAFPKEIWRQIWSNNPRKDSTE